MVTSGVFVRHRGRTIARTAPTPVIPHRQLLRSRMLELHPSTVMVRRSPLLDHIGLVDEDIPASYGEDYDWLLRAAKVAPVVAVQEPLVTVHWHQSSFFADRHAALGKRGPARRWARRTLSLDLRERRAYLALAVSLGLVPAATAVRLANAAGKGI